MSADAPRVPGQNVNGMRVYLWGGLKSHGEVVPQMWTYEHTLPGGKPARAFV
jgi:hypothetical protein